MVIFWSPLFTNQQTAGVSRSGKTRVEMSVFTGCFRPIANMTFIWFTALTDPCQVQYFAKTTEAQQSLVKQIESGDFKKLTLPLSLNLRLCLKEPKLWKIFVHDTRHHKSRIVEKDAHAGKKAVLDYKIIESLDRYQLMEINTRSGRFHQIRSQLAARGIPIFGDVKYGARRGNPDRSALGFTHGK